MIVVLSVGPWMRPGRRLLILSVHTGVNMTALTGSFRRHGGITASMLDRGHVAGYAGIPEKQFDHVN